MIFELIHVSGTYLDMITASQPIGLAHLTRPTNPIFPKLTT